MRRGSIAWMRRLALLLLAATLAVAAHAQGAAESQLLGLIAQARGRGCAGHAGVQAPLFWSAALSRAVARMDNKREPALEAAVREGYRATRIFHMDFANYRTPVDVVNAMAQHFCTSLVDPVFTDIGLYRKGPTWYVALGARLEFPQLADPRIVAAKLLALTNAARAHPRRCGERAFAAAPPLQASEALAESAQQHAQDMAAHQYLEHQGRDGSSPAQRAVRAGYRWRSIGENIAAGQPAPDDVMEDWLSSPGHCANIMSPDYVDLGVAFTVNMESRAGVYWAQEFGRPR